MDNKLLTYYVSYTNYYGELAIACTLSVLYLITSIGSTIIYYGLTNHSHFTKLSLYLFLCADFLTLLSACGSLMSLQSVDSAIDEAEDLVSDELIVMGITLKTDIDNERKHAVKNFKYLLIAGFFRLTQAVIFAATLQSCAVGKIVPLFINTGITTILALIFWYRINTSCRGKKPYERAIETQALINKYGTFDEL